MKKLLVGDENDVLHCEQAIERATAFLAGRVREDLYFLDCFASDGTPSPVHRQGRVFAAYFIASAMAHALTESPAAAFAFL